MKHRKLGIALAVSAVAFTGQLLEACGDAGGSSLVDDVRTKGTVSMSLTVAPGVTLGQLSYSVTNAAGVVVLTDTLDVSSSDTITAEFALPAGNGYRLSMSGSTSAEQPCSGSATFNVTARATTQVTLALVCEGVNDGNDLGNVAVNGTVTQTSGTTCPDVAFASVAARSIAVGQTAELHAAATASSGVQIGWTASSGTLGSSTAGDTTFTCAAVGDATLTFTVRGAGSCIDTSRLTVSCVSGGSTTPDAGSTTPDAGSTTPDAGSTTPDAGSTTPDAGSTTPDAGSTTPDAGPAPTPVCDAIVAACHPVDPGTGPLSVCHDLGHDKVETSCVADNGACVAACTAAANAPTPVTVRFAAKIGSADFACGQTYTGVGTTPGTQVTPMDLRFYVQDLKLIREDGTEVAVAIADRAPFQNAAANVALLDFENGQGSCLNGNAQTNAEITGTVPAGHYVGLVFSNGVPESVNHGDPATAVAPMNAPAMQWAWLSGFRFMRAELVQLNGTGQALVHPGTTACSGNPAQGNVTCAKPNRSVVRFAAFNTQTNTVAIDVGKIFAGDDLTADSQCHSSPAAECTGKFTALGIDFASGAALSTQTAYSVQ
jgi:uncharacterized repeat protein (TIGR04052 family)